MESVFDGAAVLQGTAVIGDTEVIKELEDDFKLTAEKLQEIRDNLPEPFNTYTGRPMSAKAIAAARQPYKGSILAKMLDKVLTHTTAGSLTTVLENRLKHLDDFRIGSLTTIVSGTTATIPYVKLSREDAMIVLDLIQMSRNMHG